MITLRILLAATMGETSLSLWEFLVYSRWRGQLPTQLRQAIIEQFLLKTATQTGLTVTTPNLQQAADRYRHGHTAAADMHAWLAARHLPLADFEDAVERDLLIDRPGDHLPRDRIDTHFAAHRNEYDRVRLLQIIVARDDLAEELSQQIHEDGADFLTVAQ